MDLRRVSSSSTGSNSPTMAICTACLVHGLNVKLNTCEYIKHIRLFHAFEPNFKFTCGIDGCIRSYTNIGTFKNHVSVVHSSATANDLNRGSDISLPEEPSQDEHLSSCDNTNDALDNTLENDTYSMMIMILYTRKALALICRTAIMNCRNHQHCFYLV